MKKIILCADDFGLNPDINEGIINLVKLGRLSATSCMTNSENWQESASRLNDIQNKADLGCHINFTEGTPLATKDFFGNQFPSLKTIIIKLFARQIPLSVIEKEVHAQIDLFKVTMNKDPDFIDGHHHIINLPIVNSVILKTCKNLSTIYVRNTNKSIKSAASLLPMSKKPLICALLGGLRFAKKLGENNIPTNNNFLGFYDFNNSKEYPNLFNKFLQLAKNKDLIMCHPAKNKTNDEIGNARLDEYNYLASEQMLKDCENNNVIITRFNQC